MLLKTIFVRFYKSFNYDYLRKNNPKVNQKPWETVNGMWYPFVQIPIEEKVTMIVGANESGKSHLLDAIEKAISGEKIEHEDFCRYSQFFTVKQGELKYPDFGTEWKDLSEEDKQKIRAVSEIPEDTDFERFFLFRTNKDILTIFLPEDKEKYKSYKLKKEAGYKILGILPHTFRIYADIALPDSVPIKQLIKRATNKECGTRVEFLERAQKAKIWQILDDFNKHPEFIKQNPIPNHIEFEKDEMIRSLITALESSGMSDKELEKREQEIDLAYKLICKVAKIDLEALFNLANSLMNGKEGYANSIIEMINTRLAESLNFPSWWVQDSKFSLLVSARDHDLVFTIRDRTQKQYSFKERSSGLKYFLSYYIQYRSHEPHGKTHEILLMDEPDAYLSSQAQQDLLKIFEAFSNPEDATQPVQVVYVTHSPFLIDKNHAERIRVLDKGNEDEGTRVVKDAAKNHYEPLRSAFGAFVGETVFIGNCNLMVEGSADQILIAGATNHLRSCNVSHLETLDLNHITIVPAGGSSHIPYLVYLACGRDVEQPAVIVLLDSDQSGNDTKANLKRGGAKRKQLIKPEFIFQIGDLKGEPGLNLPEGVAAPTEIEDLIPLPICAEAARTYAKEVCGASEEAIAFITEDMIKKNLTGGKAVFDAIKACFTELAEEGMHIEKVGFARVVIETINNWVKLDNARKKGYGNAIKAFEDNFKLLFRCLNKMKRGAERKRTDERMIEKIDRLKHNFIKDHPVSAKCEDATVLFEELESMLDDSLESDVIKSVIQNLRRDFKIETDLVKPINDYEKFKDGLNQIKYAPRLASQEDIEEE